MYAHKVKKRGDRLPGQESIEEGAGGALTLQWLASKRLSVWLLLLLGIAILTGALSRLSMTGLLLLPLSLIFLNLMAVICVNQRIRNSPSLMVLHVSLLALLAIAGVSRLTYLQGTAEILEGQEFSGKLNEYVAGPLHPWNLENVKFANEEFEVHFGPGLARQQTVNSIRWLDRDGQMKRAIIGDQDGIVLQGYRIYTSSNKGFALIFSWTRAGETKPEFGAVHMPSYPRFEGIEQNSKLVIPGVARKLTLVLDMQDAPLDKDRGGVLGGAERYPVIIRDGQERRVLNVGGKMHFPDGTLEYVGLRKWMGYKVTADPAMPWLLATAIVFVLSLAWHVAGTIRQGMGATPGRFRPKGQQS